MLLINPESWHTKVKFVRNVTEEINLISVNGKLKVVGVSPQQSHVAAADLAQDFPWNIHLVVEAHKMLSALKPFIKKRSVHLNRLAGMKFQVSDEVLKKTFPVMLAESPLEDISISSQGVVVDVAEFLRCIKATSLLEDEYTRVSLDEDWVYLESQDLGDEIEARVELVEDTGVEPATARYHTQRLIDGLKGIPIKKMHISIGKKNVILFRYGGILFFLAPILEDSL